MAKLSEIKEVTKGLKLIDPKTVIDAGRRAYHMMIERANNPRTSESEKKWWDIGWTQARDKWVENQRRER